MTMKALLLVGACACAFAAAPSAFAQAPIQFVTGAGSAIDNSTFDTAGNWGPCAVAVSASREAFQGAGGDTNVGGSGSFVVSGGAAAGQANMSVCSGTPVSMRFDVIRVVVSGSSATIEVRVTDSDDPTIVGQTGTITANDSNDRIEVSIGGRSGGFGPEQAEYSGFIDTVAHVRIGGTVAAAITHFSGTGTAVDISPDIAITRGDCTASVAGITVPTVGGGTFQTGLSAGGDIGNCFGPLGSAFRFTVTGAVTDGSTTATLSVATTDVYSGVAGPAGSIALDETANSFGFSVPPHAGGFVQGGVFGIIVTRAGVRVDTKTYVAETSGGCSVNGGGFIDADGRKNFGLNAHADGSGVRGHVNYVDHASGMHVSSIEVSSLVCSGTTATIRGTAGTPSGPQLFRVDVSDLGEPGRSDTFAIQLAPSGYTAAGTLAGGNIQVRSG
jgi:hypothetical protein